MITNIKVTFFLAAKSDKRSITTINRIKKLFHEKNIEIYSNHENIFNLKYSTNSWECHIYELLKLCESLGTQWIITGEIDYIFDAWSNKSSIVGVDSISLICENPNFY